MSTCILAKQFFKSGYGLVWIDGKARRAHRVEWESNYGPIPEGMCVLHKCDNPGCINVDHLWLGTHKQNMEDKVKKGRAFRFTRATHPMTKLHQGQVDAMVEEYVPRYGELTRLAHKYGVNRNTVRAILDSCGEFDSWKLRK